MGFVLLICVTICIIYFSTFKNGKYNKINLNKNVCSLENEKYIDEKKDKIIKFLNNKNAENCFQCIRNKNLYFDYYGQNVGDCNLTINNKSYLIENLYRVAFIEIKKEKNILNKKNIYCNERR